ncbi:MAG: carboxypeptidase-like regulatory domain-containing protein, partial [Bacteroides sp.]|nr:carboxypeptidase-like regulatory domain-containing protein [Bacteroides sp.]
MARYFYILLFLNALALTSFAQTFKGKVIDDSGNSIPYAAIYIKELQSGFATDDKGSFQTNLKAGSYTCN